MVTRGENILPELRSESFFDRNGFSTAKLQLVLPSVVPVGDTIKCICRSRISAFGSVVLLFYVFWYCPILLARTANNPSTFPSPTSEKHTPRQIDSARTKKKKKIILRYFDPQPTNGCTAVVFISYYWVY